MVGERCRHTPDLAVRRKLRLTGVCLARGALLGQCNRTWDGGLPRAKVGRQ